MTASRRRHGSHNSHVSHSSHASHNSHSRPSRPATPSSPSPDPDPPRVADAWRREAGALLREAVHTCAVLFRIMVPISIAAKILMELGVVAWLSRGLVPVMGLVGLPGSMGLVWGTAMLTSIYGGMAVFVAVAPGTPLTVAQVTVLGTMLLVAHGLPVEVRIAQKAGARLRVMLPLRVGGALVLGALLNGVYRFGGLLQQPNTLLWRPPVQDASWTAWGLGQIKGLAAIFVILLALLVLMRLLNAFGVTAFIARKLEPVLRLLGMSADVAPVTMIGLVLGLSYGGGLIIREAETGHVSRRDIVSSLALMSLCHSLIEDTLLVMLLGAHLSGALWGRLLFSLAVVFVFGRILRKLPDRILERHVFRTLGGGAARSTRNGRVASLP